MNLIYRLQFKSGQYYVGSTTNLTKRLAVLRHNRVGTCSAALRQAIKDDPEFEVHVVACALNVSTMHEVETAVIAQERELLNVWRPTPNKAAPPKPRKMRERIIHGKTINEWAKEMGLASGALHARIHLGWSDDEVVGIVKRPNQIRKEMADEERLALAALRAERARRRQLREEEKEDERRRRAVELIEWLERTGIQV